MSNPGRNQICPCGSGKKFKHCCYGRKPLSHAVGVELETPQAIQSARISPDGKVEFIFSDPAAKVKSGWVSIHRQRKKGDKTIAMIPTSAESLQIGNVHALLKYDYIFGIDTNSRLIKDRMVSASHVAQLRFHRKEDELSAEYASLGGFEFHNVKEKQENLGWFALQAAILASPEHASQNQYGIITDSDLGNHRDYNSRAKPFFLNNVLAPNFTLIYSSEEGRGITNELINHCDKTSTETLKDIESGQYPIETALEFTEESFTHFRGWYNSNSEFAEKGWFKIAQIYPTKKK